MGIGNEPEFIPTLARPMRSALICVSNWRGVAIISDMDRSE